METLSGHPTSAAGGSAEAQRDGGLEEAMASKPLQGEQRQKVLAAVWNVLRANRPELFELDVATRFEVFAAPTSVPTGFATRRVRGTGSATGNSESHKAEMYRAHAPRIMRGLYQACASSVTRRAPAGARGFSQFFVEVQNPSCSCFMAVT